MSRCPRCLQLVVLGLDGVAGVLVEILPLLAAVVESLLRRHHLVEVERRRVLGIGKVFSYAGVTASAMANNAER